MLAGQFARFEAARPAGLSFVGDSDVAESRFS
jgi:hypothetical protein